MGAPQPPQGGGDGGNRTKLVAIIAATAVVVAAGVTGFLVLGGNKDDKAEGGTNNTSGPSTSASADPSDSASAADDNPRGTETEKPTIAGWKVVVNPKWGIAFDVPADWEVQSPASGSASSSRRRRTRESRCRAPPSTSPSGAPRTTTRTAGPRTPLAVVGTKGASGAKNSDEVAINTPVWWVFGGYTQPDKKSLSYDKKATPFTTASGITGSVGWAQSTHTPDKGKCASDGKALTFGFKNSAADFVSFNFYGAKGVKDEVAKATIMKILGTVRLHGTPTGG